MNFAISKSGEGEAPGSVISRGMLAWRLLCSDVSAEISRGD